MSESDITIFAPSKTYLNVNLKMLSLPQVPHNVCTSRIKKIIWEERLKMVKASKKLENVYVNLNKY